MDTMPEVDEDIAAEAAAIMLKSGLATISEVALLRGMSRQAVHQATLFDARHRRRQYLNKLWKDLITRLTET